MKQKFSGQVGRGRPRRYDFYDMEVGDRKLIRGDFRTCGECPEYRTALVYACRSGVKFSGRITNKGVLMSRVTPVGLTRKRKKAGRVVEVRSRKYDFHDMEVGETKLIKGDFEDTNDCPEYKAAQAYARRSGGKFRGRTTNKGLWLTRTA